MTTVTPELRRAIEQAGDVPVRLEDPETNRSYILIRAEDYERLTRLIAADDDAAESMERSLAELEPEDWEDASNYGL